MTAPSAVILKDVAVGYNRRAVLANINKTIGRGDCIGLLGANGSGKTTLLKTIAGVLPPIRGEVLFPDGGSGVVGYVPQRELLEHPFFLSNLEVVLMGACCRVGPGKPIRKRERLAALDCLRRTGVAELDRRPFAEISGGQKQRVLIARALMARPELLLLDEPTAGVDEAATAAITELLRALNAGGMTILMVNHDLSVVRGLCRTVWRVRNAQLQAGELNQLLKAGGLEQHALE